MLRTARRMRLTVKLVFESFSFFSCQSRSRFVMSFGGHPERERVCQCVCLCERESERESERACVCVCVCVCVSE